MKSIIRWAGSKRRLLPELRSSIPADFKTYIEPFAGSACLFFDLQPKRALLSDLNRELIITYREIRYNAERVLSCFRRLKLGEQSYYRVRDIEPASLHAAELAARFIYLNRFCFNGLYRTNSKGKFNVPYGPPTKPLVRFETDVAAAAEILQNAELIEGDFAATLGRVERGDLVYLDPPYVLDERRVFTEYLPGSFMRTDLARLEHWLVEIDRRGAVFVLSYSDSAEARSLVEPWHFRQVIAPRNIAGFTGARRSDTELLASNRPF